MLTCRLQVREGSIGWAADVKNICVMDDDKVLFYIPVDCGGLSIGELLNAGAIDGKEMTFCLEEL